MMVANRFKTIVMDRWALLLYTLLSLGIVYLCPKLIILTLTLELIVVLYVYLRRSTALINLIEYNDNLDALKTDILYLRVNYHIPVSITEEYVIMKMFFIFKHKIKIF